jgi:hypothetical protein
MKSYISPAEIVFLEKIEPYLVYNENSELNKSSSLKMLEGKKVPDHRQIELPVWWREGDTLKFG